ncbi:hypothetical protein HDU97_005116 [Phlyctochytrium planicorne]|nr:hypothetical protein HDU97_005116 [Phlyctochytrium planicorne]
MSNIKFKNPSSCGKIYDCSASIPDSACVWTGSRFQCTLNSGYTATVDGSNATFSANSVLCSPELASLKSGIPCDNFQVIVSVKGTPAYAASIERKSNSASHGSRWSLWHAGIVVLAMLALSGSASASAHCDGPYCEIQTDSYDFGCESWVGFGDYISRCGRGGCPGPVRITRECGDYAYELTLTGTWIDWPDRSLMEATLKNIFTTLTCESKPGVICHCENCPKNVCQRTTPSNTTLPSLNPAINNINTFEPDSNGKCKPGCWAEQVPPRCTYFIPKAGLIKPKYDSWVNFSWEIRDTKIAPGLFAWCPTINFIKDLTNAVPEAGGVISFGAEKFNKFTINC